MRFPAADHSDGGLGISDSSPVACEGIPTEKQKKKDNVMVI